MDFSTHLFHPSSLGKIMTSARVKSDPLGETCKKALVACYIEAKYGRKKDISSKYIEKGLAVEEDSITLYSRVRKVFFKKNAEQIKNDFFIGTPDLYIGESLQSAKTIIDIKSSWDIHTFFNVFVSPINSDYYWQGQAYMDLTGADTFKLAYCLVNTPETLINDAKRKLMYNMGAIDDQLPEVVEALAALEKEMVFDDIPKEERWIEFTIPRNDEDIQAAKDKIKYCRAFLNTIANQPELATV